MSLLLQLSEIVERRIDQLGIDYPELERRVNAHRALLGREKITITPVNPEDGVERLQWLELLGQVADVLGVTLILLALPTPEVGRLSARDIELLRRCHRDPLDKPYLADLYDQNMIRLRGIGLVEPLQIKVPWVLTSAGELILDAHTRTSDDPDHT